jgi:DNA-binding NarL/FixJ family response regulator
MSIRVLLVDDHAIVRAGLRALLEREPGLEIIAEAGNGAEAVRIATEQRPDVVVMDISMREMNGIEATRCLREKSPGIKVLALSMESDRRFVVETLKAGAKGYLVKDCAAEELVDAISSVAADNPYLGPRITELILKDYLERLPEQTPVTFSLLSPREREVLQLIADGKSTKEIAFTFGVSIKTVDTQRHQIMKKLDLYSIAELTKYAVREGLTSLG